MRGLLWGFIIVIMISIAQPVHAGRVDKMIAKAALKGAIYLVKTYPIIISAFIAFKFRHSIMRLFKNKVAPTIGEHPIASMVISLAALKIVLDHAGITLTA